MFNRIPFLSTLFIVLGFLILIAWLRGEHYHGALDEVRVWKSWFLDGDRETNRTSHLAEPPGKQADIVRVEQEPAHIAVLVVSCDRATISRALDAIFRYRPSDRFPVVVSQGCENDVTSNVIERYRDRLIHLVFPEGDPINYHDPHERIADHYRWALDQVFDILEFEQVIMVEDDMEVSPDFFSYFDAMLPILKRDPSLYCVSSWNDNGKGNLVSDPKVFYRSDFMPGLGWMMLRRLWMEEFRAKWPKSNWDDWMRSPDQRRGRSCIIPEISRNFNFGKKGSSGGMFYDEHIGKTLANTELVDYATIDVNALEKSRYDATFLEDVYQRAELVSLEAGTTFSDVEKIISDRYQRSRDASSVVRVRTEYANGIEFERLASVFSLMTDIRVDVPRASYQGVVTMRPKVAVDGEKERIAVVYVAPVQMSWNGSVDLMGAHKKRFS